MDLALLRYRWVLLLYDVREYDENGEALKFNPRKQDELQCSLTGQAVPIATKGVFLFATGAWATDGARLNSAGASVYATGNGQLTPTRLGPQLIPKVGKALADHGFDGAVLVKFEL